MAKPNGVRQSVRRHERDQEADMRIEARQLPQPRVGRHERRLQEPGAGLAERSRQRLLDQQQADEIEEQRDQHFVDPALEMDGGRDRRPQRAEHGRSDQRSGREEPGREMRPVKRDRCGAEPAERDLAFGADVDDARAKAESDPGARQQIRRGAMSATPI
jgi:hypothetical protein